MAVAAVQGNIPQSFKWNALQLAVHRYNSMTRAIGARASATGRLAGDGDTDGARSRTRNCIAQFSAARAQLRRDARRRRDRLRTVTGLYNALYIFSPERNA